MYDQENNFYVSNTIKIQHRTSLNIDIDIPFFLAKKSFLFLFLIELRNAQFLRT